MGFSLPFFPMYAAETLADGRFQGWNLEERGAWITLLCANWNDGDIPEGHTALARLLSIETGDMARIWSAIGDRFSPAPGQSGRLICPRLEEERDKAVSLSQKRAKAGERGAKARWNQGKPENGKRMRLPQQTHGKANAVAMRSECPVPSPSPSPPPSQSSALPERLRSLSVHLQGQCPGLAALLRDSSVSVDVGKAATLWGEAEAIVKAAGADVVESCWVATAAKRSGSDAVPLAYLIHPMRDLLKRATGPPSRGPQPVGKDFSVSLNDLEG